MRGKFRSFIEMLLHFCIYTFVTEGGNAKRFAPIDELARCWTLAFPTVEHHFREFRIFWVLSPIFHSKSSGGYPPLLKCLTNPPSSMR